MAVGNVETEAKWRSDERGHDELRARLHHAGATHTRTVRETNTLLDSPDNLLRQRGHVLRLREVDGVHNVLTLKGRAVYREGLKIRRETEVHVADRDAMIGILAGIGFGVSIEYRKTRESWELGGATVELDTLDFGRFVEIEGTQEQIRRTAKLLGLEMAEAERRGYPSMMRAHEAAARPADIESLDAPDGSRTGVDADQTRARPPD